MKFTKIVAMRGPNIWAKSPVLEAWVDLGDLKDSPSNEMPGFNERIMGWLPTMIEHECSIGERGGFFERLRRGTYLAHILEHVTLELQALAGSPIGYGRARETTTEGLFRVAFRYEEEEIARAAVEAGRELCLAAVYDQPYDIAEVVRELQRLADDVRMGPSTKTMALAAKARGIPVRRLSSGSLVQLGHGSRQHRIHRSATDRTGAVAEAVSDDKQITKQYLQSAGLPVARGRIVTSPADAWQAAQEIATPVVVKPRDCNYGNGVVIGVTEREQIEGAYENAFPQGSGVMVEQMAHGAEHRLLVVGGKFVAATRGTPAVVVADGQQTIAELVESQLNSDPRRGEDSSCPLAKVEFDPTVLLVLRQEGYTPDSVPVANKKVVIQRNGNLSEDVTDLVHEQVRRQAEAAADVIGLDVAGIDIIAEDISQPLEPQGGVIIEINAGPGLQMHVAPESGEPRAVGEAIVATLYPEGSDGRIPIVAIVDSEPKTELAMAIADELAKSQGNVATCTVKGLSLAGRQLRSGDCRDADTIRNLLLNPHLDAAVCETSLERVAEEGLGFDRCRVAVLGPIGNGIRLDVGEWDTPEKRVLVHRTVTDILVPYGTLIAPAGDLLLEQVAPHSDAPLMLYALAEHPVIAAHCAEGGRAAFVRDGRIVLAKGTSERLVKATGKHSPTETELLVAAVCWAINGDPE